MLFHDIPGSSYSRQPAELLSTPVLVRIVLAETSIVMLISIYMLYCESTGYVLTGAKNDPMNSYRLDWRLIGLSFHGMTLVYIPGFVLTIYVQIACRGTMALWSLVLYWVKAFFSMLWSIFIIGVFIVGITCLDEVKDLIKIEKRKAVSRKAILDGLFKKGSLDTYLKHAYDIGNCQDSVYKAVFYQVLPYKTRNLLKSDLCNIGKSSCPWCLEAFRVHEAVVDLNCCISSRVHQDCMYSYTRTSKYTACCKTDFVFKLTKALKLLKDKDQSKSEESDLHPLD